jgi:hypothetical protein
MRDSTLQGTALRYAAGDLPPDEVEAFERRLADDQDARDALSEAVRLSAAALGQAAPAPDRSFRTRLRARLGLSYRGPLAWSALGAAVVAACALLAVSAADRARPLPASPLVPADAAPTVASAEAPALPEPAPPESLPTACGDERSVAEIWADLSGHEGVEKSHDEEMKWRQKVRDLSHPHHVSSAAKSDTP